MKQYLSSDPSPTEIEVLIEKAVERLAQQGYKPGPIAEKRSCWGRLARFAGEEAFSADLAQRFLVHEGVADSASPSSLTFHQRKTVTAIRILSEIALHGFFQRRTARQETIALTPVFEEIRAGYMDFCCAHLGHRPQTWKLRRRVLSRFLAFAHAHGAVSADLFDARLISSFVAAHAHQKPKTVSAICGSLRSLMRFLCMRGVVPAVLQDDVPLVHVPRDARIPLGWRPEEIAAILGAVDRGSPVGRRDRAILLLAARLGMRPGDIRRLHLDDLHWGQARIELTQEKTGVSLVLPLTDEVGSAIIDYLRHGRPPTSHREVFLRMRAPFEPFDHSSALYAIITTYRRRASIPAPTTRKGGMRGLRHALASRLLEVGTSIETISHVMGHVTPETTMVYAKVGIEDLRSVALSLEAGHE
jgi:integrase